MHYTDEDSRRNDIAVMREIDWQVRVGGVTRSQARYARMANIERDAEALLNSDFDTNEDYAYITA